MRWTYPVAAFVRHAGIHPVCGLCGI